MKEYNKEKLHEYAKELFALCLDKKIQHETQYDFEEESILLNYSRFTTSINKESFQYKDEEIGHYPI